MKLDHPGPQLNPPSLPAPSIKTRTASRVEVTGSEHVVQFYETDAFLVETVGEYLASGLKENGTALVIATPDHESALLEHLRSREIPADAWREQGRLVMLDALKMTNLLLVSGRPSPLLFEQHIGAWVRKLSVGPGRLRVFGEIVALLWGQGQTDAAIELEELWNKKSQEQNFSLLCAYPIRGFGDFAEDPPFLHVCSAHSRILPAENHQLKECELTPDAQARQIAVLQQKAAALENEIARRKESEALAKRREAELSAFVETASLGLHWVDTNGIIIWANQAEMDLLGYSATEYIGRHIAEFHADPATIDDILSRLCRGQKLRDYEARLRCKNGEIKNVLIDSSVLWENGEFIHTQCFTRDVTEQRHVERRSQHLAAIVESSDDAILSKNLDGIITSWNQAAERIFGYTADEVVGKPVTILIPPDRLQEEPHILSQLRRGERVDHFETIRRRKDGSLVDISLTISPIRDAKGVIIGASKIARDISSRRKIEHALEMARLELARSNNELDRRVQERTSALSEAVAQLEEFSYTVSHDLRAPLRGMHVYTQVLLEDHRAELSPEAVHCLNRIADNATRLDKMVADVLTFSRVSRAELRMENVSLDKLVRDVVQHYPALQAPRAKVEIAPLHDVWAHEPSVVQVVSNLLSNAVKFVAPDNLPRVRVWSESHPGVVTLWIQDNGIGIAPEYQSRLFRMFERLHPDLPYEGTGVGLAIVRKAVTRMGGDVGVQSAEGQGAAFWVRLAAAKPAVPAKEGQSS